MTKNLSPNSLWYRLWGHNWIPSLFTGILIVLLSAAVTAAPRALNALFDQELTHNLSDQLTPSQEYLIASAQVLIPLSPAEHPDQLAAADPSSPEQWGNVYEWLYGIKAGMPPSILENTGTAEVFNTTNRPIALEITEPSSFGAPAQSIFLSSIPRYESFITLTEGRMPEFNSDIQLLLTFGFGGQSFSFSGDDETLTRYFELLRLPFAERPAVEITLNTTVADAMQWPLGEKRYIAAAAGEKIPLQLVGLWTQQHPDDPFWSITSTVTSSLTTISIFDDGDRPPNYRGTALLHPEAWPWLTSNLNVPHVLQAWFEFDASAITTENAAEYLVQLQNFTGRSNPVPSWSYPASASLTFSTQVLPYLETTLANIGTTSSIMTLIALGPLLTGILILVLANRLILNRRQPHLALIFARGASLTRVRIVHWVEGILTAFPAALLGVATAALTLASMNAGQPTLPVPQPSDLAVLLGFTLGYSLLLAAAVRRTPLQDSRTDLGVKRRSPVRFILEFAVMLLAGFSLYLFLSQGVTAVNQANLLSALTPILLILAGSIVVLRIYALPLRFAQTVFQRGRNFTNWFGTLRTLRESGPGLLPLLSLILALSTAVFSGMLLSGISEEKERSAWLNTGGDLAVTYPLISDEQLNELNSSGIVQAATLTTILHASLDINGQQKTGTLVFADFEQLSRVQQSSPWRIPLENLLSTSSAPFAVFDSRLNATLESTAEVLNVDVVVGATSGTLAGMPLLRDWVLVDSSHLSDFSSRNHPASTVIIGLEPGATLAEAEALVHQVFNGAGVVSRPDTQLDRINSQPTTNGLATALTIAMLFSALLAVISLALSSSILSASRQRWLPLLQGLGVTRKQSRALIIWELLPMALAALGASIGLGIGVTMLTLTKLNLAGFTGGSASPPLHFSALQFGLMLAVFVLTLIILVTMNHRNSKRKSLITILRSSQ